MKKTLSLVLALVMILSAALSLFSCGKKDDTATTQTLPVCLASEPDNIDPALNSAVDGATLVLHAFAGLVGYDKDLKLVADCAKALPEATVADDGKVTYVFELKDDLKWSDGSELTAADFVYAWNRAADPTNGSDYYYMFDVIDGFADVEAGVEGAKLNVTADGNKITIVLKNDVPYFFELLAFPTYMPVKQSVVEGNEGWATDPATYIGNGPYKMTDWEHNSKITYTKNENYHNADAVTMDVIEFYLSDDSNNMLANYRNGDWLFIDDVPVDEMDALEEDYPEEYKVMGQLGTYYVNFNVNKSVLPADTTLTGAEKELAEAEVRSAIALLLDRDYLVKEIGKAGQVPASTFVAMGLTDTNDKEFYENAGNSDEYIGYYDASAEAFSSNCDKAVTILKKYFDYDEATKKFTNVPTLDYIYNTNDQHQAVGEYIQQALAVYGINMTLTNQEWNTFLNTRKEGQYNVARNGWLGDYNDPISFLDMWISGSGNNDVQFGKDAHKDVAVYSLDLTDLGIDYKVENATWADTYDYVVGLIKTETNKETRYALMHKAEDLLMSTGCICPIWYYTDVYMCDDSVKGAFASPLGYKYFMFTTIEG